MKGPDGYSEEDWLALSGIQHFSFCKRQWALIHIEQLWSENYLTTAGHLEHERAHDYAASESRGDMLIMRDLRVYSRALGITGACDVVEFHKSNDGVPLHGRDELWLPYPIEYKHGKSKTIDADRLQLCAEAMCLEEMLACDIEAKQVKQLSHPIRDAWIEILQQWISQTQGKCRIPYGMRGLKYDKRVRPDLHYRSYPIWDTCIEMVRF